MNMAGYNSKLQHIVMDHRRWRRMLSNRQSARRSRLRKQKHLDELVTQVTQLGAQNNRILTNINAVTQLYLCTESHNSVLKAQITELMHRAEALNHIVNQGLDN